MEALEAIVFRSGATQSNKPMFVAFDPFGAWMETCARLRLSCIVYIGCAPIPYVKKGSKRDMGRN